MSLTLLRSSYDPDPSPEWGQREVTFVLDLVRETETVKQRMEQAAIHGVPPQTLSLLGKPQAFHLTKLILEAIDGPVVVSAIKGAENAAERAWILRLVETEGKGGSVHIRLAKPAGRVEFADLHEVPCSSRAVQSSRDGLEHTFQCKPYEVITLLIRQPWIGHPVTSSQSRPE